jgi:hypothetical protein
MKVYTKLPIPDDSAFERFRIRDYIPSRILNVYDGICNIIRWAPTVYKDRDWDEYYILQILKKKIEFQREYLVDGNRHTNIEIDNYWMTVVLNLLERETCDYYFDELCGYYEVDDNSMRFIKREWFDLYFKKYKSSFRKFMNSKEGKEYLNYPHMTMDEKHSLAVRFNYYLQLKNRRLLFEILNRFGNHWWD